MVKKFWEIKSLTEMTPEEWESICDGCGKCCLHKLEDIDTGDIYYTRVACQWLDIESCRCSHYADRLEKEPTCVKLTPADVDDLQWLPPSCSYRRMHDGRGLADWHHLVCGDRERVHREGHSILGRCLSERDVHPDGLEEHIVHWVEQN
ncbi:YcgN family cysteine cluster protein [Litorivivens sp.]|uniref:YcgN family cysteine cluster protein n=1 Tax=Litorivivens sp. TaxID=2020868 RepID=UPI0035665119